MSSYSYQDDWRSKCKKIAEMQSEARRRNLFTDVQFVIRKRTSEKIFQAHKFVLACASPVFEGMFYGQLAEMKNPISIPEDDPDAFEMLLKYAYGEDVPINSFALAWKCYIIGDKYLMPKLQDTAADYINKTQMDEARFWEIFENTVPLNSILKQKVDVFIQNNTTNLLKSEKFLYVPLDVVQYILQMEQLQTSEYCLLESVTKWAYNKYGNKVEWRALLPLFEHIRFSTLTAEEFCKFTDTFPTALDDRNSFEIVKHLQDKSAYKLPKWCSCSNIKRNEGYSKINRYEVYSNVQFGCQKKSLSAADIQRLFGYAQMQRPRYK